MKTKAFFMTTILTLTAACGAVDKVTKKTSLDHARKETRTEREGRLVSERASGQYRYMLLHIERTANHLWTYAIDNDAPSQSKAQAVCRGIGFELPTKTQLGEAQENPNLAKILRPVQTGHDGVHTAEENEGGKVVVAILCVK
jgi:hypothetical protein